ncbi:DNA damage-inducible transcript 3 protein [Rhinatrema bivittatum]|uniref:DNA damage-inducible transcript 3 protein n=1 Tax=Rhinatrema bivittatum TaxID=194408 RepID=UPI001126A67F|nr:DNA damage-inducible transcript 3 protein [Rhinatrema bivittatum]
MTAESLPFSSCTPVPSALSGWELEAWYEDLQDILLSDVNGGAGQEPQTLDQRECKNLNTLACSSLFWTTGSLGDSVPVDFTSETSQSVAEEHFPMNMLELLNEESQLPCLHSFTTPLGNTDQSLLVPEAADSGSSTPTQTHTEDEEPSSVTCGTKRKRNSPAQGGKIRVREKEQENEQKVLQLVAENERLKSEIERLTAEVESTRKALIDRMVNIKQVEA